MNDLSTMIIDHFLRYPQMLLQDLFKLVYQNEFGCGHMATDYNEVMARLQNELELISGNLELPLIEDIGNGYARLNLAKAKQGKLSVETICRIFMMSAQRTSGTGANYLDKLALVRSLCDAGTLPFSIDVLDELKQKMIESNFAPVSHSESYRLNYQPAYRVILNDYLKFAPLFTGISDLLKDREQIIVALDGRSAAGKTTLANLLSAIYDASIIHMDDFFLPAKLRTPERFSLPGGNVHYERFLDEVCKNLNCSKSFCYRKFDCSKMDYVGKVEVHPSKLVIVEGAYSLRPEFTPYYDLKVFFDISADQQRDRILIRNGKEVFQQFTERWIPLEENYIKELNVLQTCDLIIQ